MEDERIVELYWERSETAIEETRTKYNGYCSSIAYHVLGSFEETEECISDTYLRLWNTIPPERPANFKAYLGRITHNLAIDRYRRNTAKKRSVFAEVLEEWEIPNLEDPQGALERRELAASISDFLRTQPPVRQKAFLLRYWYYEPIASISKKTGWKEARVYTELYRMRKKLKTYLREEGYAL